jgi:hypothetical protein
MTGRRMEFFRSGTNRGRKKRKKRKETYISIVVQYTFRALVIDDTARIDVAGGVRALVAPVPQGLEVSEGDF